MKEITLTQGQVATVCDCHAHLVEGHKWSANWSRHTKSFYAIRNQSRFLGRTTIQMHRVINRTPKGLQTDHINGDTLDNRCSNLRTVTNAQNAMNQSIRSNNTSGMKGVNWDAKNSRWRAEIRLNGKTKNLGRFDTFEDAVAARKAAEQDYHGEFARG